MTQAVRRIIGIILFVPWIYCAYEIFIQCPWLNGGPTIDLDAFWASTERWTYLTLGVIVYVIFVADTSALRTAEWRRDDVDHADTSNRRVILLGLIGGFAIALPALSITLLAFVTAYPHFIEALRGGAHDPSRPAYLVGKQRVELKTAESRLGSAYVLGIDVSHSVIRNKKEEELVQINTLIGLLFSPDPDRVLASLIDSDDDYWSYAFAGDQYPLPRRGGAFEGGRSAAFPEEFRQALEEHLESDADRNDTDILAFLKDMVDNIEKLDVRHSHVTLLVFSDFKQDSGDLAYANIKEKVRELMRDIRALRNVHLVGIHVDANGEEGGGIDIRRYLDYYSREGLWREISLESFSSANIERQKAMLAFGIYQEARQEESLYLKYQVAPWKPIAVNIAIDKDPAYDGIILGLRPSRGSDGSTPRIQAVLGNQDPTVLTIGGGGADFDILSRDSSDENPLPISLQSKLDVSRSLECELLVAVPSRALVHTIPIVILPVIGDLPLQIFRLSLRFIGWILMFLSIGALGIDELVQLAFRKSKRRIREKLRPTPQSKPTENPVQEA